MFWHSNHLRSCIFFFLNHYLFIVLTVVRLAYISLTQSGLSVMSHAMAKKCLLMHIAKRINRHTKVNMAIPLHFYGYLVTCLSQSLFA